jgi:hypothetical protein
VLKLPDPEFAETPESETTAASCSDNINKSAGGLVNGRR